MFLSFIEAPRWAIMGLAVKIAQSVSNLQDQSEATYPYSISQPIPLSSTFLDRLTCVFRVFSYHTSSKPIFLSDRDSERWKLEPDEAYKRRSLMWELYTYDSWQVRGC